MKTALPEADVQQSLAGSQAHRSHFHRREAESVQRPQEVLSRRRERRLFAAVGAAVFVLSLAVPAACNLYLEHLGPLDLSASRHGSTIVVDRDGRLLRAFTLP